MACMLCLGSLSLPHAGLDHTLTRIPEDVLKVDCAEAEPTSLVVNVCSARVLTRRRFSSSWVSRSVRVYMCTCVGSVSRLQARCKD